ncbi:MAG: fibrobacter succinogenes major paralogous domain-containing protein [Prevotellaceae bacterium]|jgi:hypothetical protein|nr:fibrobacter succinogenes major paralogous domain-containing protein [Prevotellaceae bacterium]
MKKLILLSDLALSVSTVWGQGVVQVSTLRITIGATPTLTFEVGWATAPTPPNHRDTVWLFADYRIVNTDGTTGAWTAATITDAMIIAGDGSIIAGSLPGRGFFLNGHNVALPFAATVTVTLAAPANTKFNACVYASDYPPNATQQSGGGYVLRGTPPFIINGTITEPSYTFGAGTCITSITDSTGCPGFVVNTSIVTGSILTIGDTVCVGGAPGAITSIAAFGGDGQLSYSWWKDGVLIPGATAADYTPPVEDAAVAGVYTYTRRVNDQTCNLTPLASEGSWVLTVGEVPTVTLAASSTTVCAGTEVILEASAAGVDSYNFNNSGWQPDNTTNITVNSDTTFTVKARSALGCESATAASTTVAVNAPPTAPTGLTSNITTICNGISTAMTLTASGGNDGSGAVYQWGTGATVGSYAAGTTTANTYKVNPNAATTYWVRRIGATACTDTTGGTTATVAVYSSFTAGSITTASGNTTPGSNPGITIANATLASGGDGNITYQWRRSGTSAATMSYNSATYPIGNVASDYETVGTYYFTRYAHDGTCNTSWNPSSGQYMLTVAIAVPPGSDPASTFTCGSQIWSGALRNGANCTDTSSLSGEIVYAWQLSPQYFNYSSNYGYYYNWACVNMYGDTLCPSPWRVPTQNDFNTLANCTSATTLCYTWGLTCRISGNTLDDEVSYAYYWSSTPQGELYAFFFYFDCSVMHTVYSYLTYGLQVRCVRDAQ